MASKRIIINKTITRCKDCPHMYWQEDDDPMGGNGWPCCNKLAEMILIDHRKDIDPRCPLPDAV